MSLPVPRIPTVNQLSSIEKSVRGTAKNRTSGRTSGSSGRSAGTAAQASAQSAKCTPLMYFHSPLSRQPPATGSALPDGMSAPASRTSGPSAQISAWPSAGRNAAYRPA